MSRKRPAKRAPIPVGFAALVELDLTNGAPSLAEVHRAAVEQVGRAYLEALHREHGDNLSAIARAARATRLQVRTYMRRYRIGPFAQG